MVKVALAGLGFMGKMHLGIYLNKLKGVEVTALCDVNSGALNIKSLDAGGNIETDGAEIDLSGIRKYPDYKEMLKDGGFDFVDICLPTYLHADAAVDAMDTGFHVFCEKPMAISVKEAERIVDKVHETGKLFSVGQCLRYWPAYTEIKRLIDSGKYGKVRYAEFARFSMTPAWTWDNWILDGRLSGNAALDLHIHDVDMILFLFGKPEGLKSNGIAEKDGSISHITTLYQYRDKVVTSSGGWICSGSFGFNMRAMYILEKATVELDFSRNPVVMVYPGEGEKYPLPLAEGDGYYYELRNFAENVAAGSFSGTVTPESALESVRVCFAEIDSAKRNKEIRI